jgi:hypothetical protein
MDDLWLPEGHHWDLHIEHRSSSNNAGGFTGGGWKFVLHTTEGGSLQSNSDLLAGTNTPHLLFGAEPGRDHWTVVQFLPFNVAGKTLANNPGDGFQTNRANAIQVEIVGFTAAIPDWSDVMYQRLANLIVLVQHRVPIPCRAPLDFSSKTNRMADAEWVKAAGIIGHMHAPDNDHVDPYRLREGYLVELVKNCPDGGYDL